MGSYSYFSFFFSVLLVWTTMAILFMPMIAATDDNSTTLQVHTSKLQNFYKSPRNRFNSFFVLSQLEDKMNICQEFGIENIDYVYIGTVILKTDSSEKGTSVQVLECNTLNFDEGEFSVAMPAPAIEPETLLYKLQTINYNMDEGIARLVESKAFPSYKNYLEDVENNLMTFLSSEDYKESATNFFAGIINSHWDRAMICNELRDDNDSEEYELPAGISDQPFEKVQLITLNVTIYDNKPPVEIPLFPCPLGNGSNNVNYAALISEPVMFRVRIADNNKAVAEYQLRSAD